MHELAVVSFPNGEQLFGIAAVIGAVAGLITSAVAAWVVIRTGRKMDSVQTVVSAAAEKVGVVQETAEKVLVQVETINSKTIANLADDAETRRVEAIPEKDRSLEDRSHMVDVEKAEKKQAGSPSH